ncbi:dienelactone hydrolase family protein [Xanthobacter oligotrophicus]|uniref:Dienelactone hydrolase family protein n=1 Tax=Xanthobacter oligotrophicus TaxID=2607286 RepID=A0ABW6ZWP8_9HYPH
MSNGFIELQSKDGYSFEAFLALPDQPNGAGLVILPEVYNVNAWVQGIATRYAKAGYTVLVPDLFWRQQPGVHLDYDQVERARAQGEAVDVDGVVGDVGQAARALRERLGEGAKVGVIGFCLGGRLALLAGIREPVDSVSAFYAVKLERHLDELPKLAVPTAIHFGATDPWVPTETVAAVQRIYAQVPHVGFHRYADTGHGFARNGYPPHVEDAAERAHARTLALFETALLPPAAG